MRCLLDIPTILTLLLSLWAATPPKTPADAGSVERPSAVVGAPFKIRETDHFKIAYNTDYEVLRPLIGRMEGTFDSVWRFCMAHDLVDKPPAERLEVLVFDRFEEFTRYSARVGVATGTIVGFYHPKTNVAVFCNMHNSPAFADLGLEIDRVKAQIASLSHRDRSTTRIRRKKLTNSLINLTGRSDWLVKRFNRFVVQHEVAHQLLFNVGVHIRGANNPDWLVEGLACQFEVPQSDGAGKLKRINQLRLGDFREAVGIPVAVDQAKPIVYAAALASGRVIPLIDLIGGAVFSEDRGEHIPYRYAQAWALVYYLFRTDRRTTERYVRQLALRTPGEAIGAEREIADFESFFGEVNAALETKWVAYMLKLRYDPDVAGR